MLRESEPSCLGQSQYIVNFSGIPFLATEEDPVKGFEHWAVT